MSRFEALDKVTLIKKLEEALASADYYKEAYREAVGQLADEIERSRTDD